MSEFEKKMIAKLIKECREKQMLAYGSDKVACNADDLTDYRIIATGLIRNIIAYEETIEINKELEELKSK